jgi:hypothetical protein
MTTVNFAVKHLWSGIHDRGFILHKAEDDDAIILHDALPSGTCTPL